MASLLALAGLASAMAFPQHRAHKRSNDLIPIRHFASDDTATIRSAGSATTLQPIRPGRSSKGDGRSRQSAFKLRDEDSLYWGGADGTVAELRVDMPGETEAVVDIEYFDDLIESMQCPQNGTGDVVIDFLDHADLSAAGEIWDWVNQHPDHSFLLMVGAGDCGWNQDRILYNIRGLDFTESSKIATLHGQPIDWRTALHSYELNIGKAAKQNGTSRGFFDDIGDFFGGEYNPSLSFPFEHDISGESISFSIDGVQFSGTCAECSTAGSFDVQAKFHVSWFELKEAYVELSTPGIDATAVIDVTVKGDLTDTLLQQSLPIFKASPAGISIPGIVTIGPTVSIALNAGVSAIKGSVTLTLGGTATIPPSNSRLDFLNEDGTGSEGWEPHFESVPLEADILVEATASVALNAAVGLEVSALGKSIIPSQSDSPFVTAANLSFTQKPDSPPNLVLIFLNCPPAFRRFTVSDTLIDRQLH